MKDRTTGRSGKSEGGSRHRADLLRGAVRSRYAAIAASVPRTGDGCCAVSTDGCGGGPSQSNARAESARTVGYSDADLCSKEAEANLGLGCGNPGAIAELRAGERVLDLGSGAGFDCFLAGRSVGPTGHVIGVDMTPEMIERARAIAREHRVTNVEFRLGEIEHLPVADESVDVVISNCVINLSPEKEAILKESFRVLAPGGRLAVADVVAVAEMPSRLREEVTAYTDCLAGATPVETLRELLERSGFVDIRIELAPPAGTAKPDETDSTGDRWVTPAHIRARKGR